MRSSKRFFWIRAEAARERKMSMGRAQPSPEDHLIEKEVIVRIRRTDTAIVLKPFLPSRLCRLAESMPGSMLGMKVKDIAAMEGITPSQAGKSIHAALRRLRRYFARQKMDGQSMSISKEKRCLT